MNCIGLFAGCTCDSFVDNEGHGNCKKSVRDQFGCYVNEPTNCTDLEIGNEDRKYSLSQACELVGNCI